MPTPPPTQKVLSKRTPGKTNRVLPFPVTVKAWQSGILVLVGAVMCGFIIWHSLAAGR